MKALEGRAFGDEIRIVDHLGMRLDRFAASSEYIILNDKPTFNYVNGNG